MDCIINKVPNLFVVDIYKKQNNFSSVIESIKTTKIKPNSIGATHLKSQLEYNNEDAEVWIFVAGGAPI